MKNNILQVIIKKIKLRFDEPKYIDHAFEDNFTFSNLVRTCITNEKIFCMIYFLCK